MKTPRHIFIKKRNCRHEHWKVTVGEVEAIEGKMVLASVPLFFGLFKRKVWTDLSVQSSYHCSELGKERTPDLDIND